MQNKAVTYEKRMVRHIVLAVFACFPILCPFFTAAKADNRGVDEATLRAAIILKIIHQVNWPHELGPQINFCSTGDSKSFQKLRSLQGKPIAQGKSRIVFIDPSVDDAPCHVQIIGAQTSNIVGVNNNSVPQLVICDDCGPQITQAAVELVKDNDHIRFNLNLAEARKKQIQFKVSLLELAKTVKGHNE